jgi:repressor LexA
MGNRAGQLSQTQARILDFIIRFKYEHGYSPVMREIAESVNLKSSSSVKHQLDRLAEAGYLDLKAGLARGIQVLISPPGMLESRREDEIFGDLAQIPIVGRIAAGTPITAEQNIEEIIPVSRNLVGKGDLFILQIQGDSMIDAAICDGDLVVIRSQKTAENGEIVAAMIDGEATCKVFKQRDGHSWLLPRNSAYEPIPADNVEILGKVVTVLRRL